MRIIEQLVYKITGDNSEFDKSITQSETKVSKFGSVADKMLAGVTVAAIGMVVKKMGDMVISSATALDRVDKLSQKIGLSRVAFQEWDYILGQSGASVEGLQMGLKTLSGAADEAMKGTEQYKESFDRLGVSVTDINGKMKDQETLFAEVFSALADMENQTERTALASDLLGRSATELAPTLNTSKEEIEQLRKEAHDLGLVYSDELVDAGVVLGDNIDRLKKSFDSLKTKALAPIIGLAVTFTDKLLGQNTGTKNLDDSTRSLVTQSKAYKDILTQLKDPTVILTDAERARLEILKGIQAQNLEDTIYQTNRAYKDGIADVRKAEQTLADLEATQAAYTLVTKSQSEAIKRRDELSKTKNRTDAETLELSKLKIALMDTEFQRQTELLSLGDRIGEQKEKANALNGATAESVRAVATAVEAETLSISQYALTSPDFYSAVMAQVDAIKEEKQATLDATEAFKEYSTWSDVMIAGKIAELEIGERSLAGEKLLQMLYQKRNEILAVSAQKSAELAEKEKARKEILNTMAKSMASAEQYALALGDSYDLNSQKASILESAIKSLIDSGLNAESEEVKNLKAQLLALVPATEEVTDARKIAYDKIAESRMSDKEKALKAIQEQADAFLKAGVLEADVSKWQSEQTAKYEEEETKKLEQEEKAKKKVRDDAYAEIERSGMDAYQLAVDNIEKQTQAYIDAGVSIVDAEAWKNNELAKLQEEQADKAEEEAERTRKAWEDATFSMLRSVTSIWGSINQVQANQNEEELNRIRSRQEEELSILTDKKDTELALLKEKLDNGIISEEAYEKAKEQIDAEYTASKDSQEAELNSIKAKYAKEEADRNKALSTLSVILDTAKAIMQIWANPLIAPWGKGVWTGLAAGAGAAQIAAINSAPVPSYDVGSIRIPETTQAVVHKDEMILTAPQAEQARREGITIAPTNTTSGRIPIQNVIYLDGKQISEAVVQYLNSGSVGTIKTRVVK